MNASKSAQLLITAYNYEEQGQKVLCLTSAKDTRSGVGKIKSRIGLERDATPLYEDTDVYGLFLNENMKQNLEIAAVLIDEAHFCTDRQIDDLARIVDEQYTPVIAYGLKNNFKGELFGGAKRLLEIADKLEEIKAICSFCSKKAHLVLRYQDDIPVKDGPEVLIGGNDMYKSVCRSCFMNPPKLRH